MKADLQRVRISPKKAHMVAKVVRGMNAKQALAVLSGLPHKSAFYLRKVLKSAIANAENNHKTASDDLRLEKVEVLDGPRYRRYRAGSKGSAKKIIKRTSHLKVTLSK